MTERRHCKHGFRNLSDSEAARSAGAGVPLARGHLPILSGCPGQHLGGHRFGAIGNPLSGVFSLLGPEPCGHFPPSQPPRRMNGTRQPRRRVGDPGGSLEPFPVPCPLPPPRPAVLLVLRPFGQLGRGSGLAGPTTVYPHEHRSGGQGQGSRPDRRRRLYCRHRPHQVGGVCRDRPCRLPPPQADRALWACGDTPWLRHCLDHPQSRQRHCLEPRSVHPVVPGTPHPPPRIRPRAGDSPPLHQPGLRPWLAAVSRLVRLAPPRSLGSRAQRPPPLPHRGG